MKSSLETAQTLEDTEVIANNRSEDRRILRQIIDNANSQDTLAVELTIGRRDVPVFTYGISDFDLDKHNVSNIPAGGKIRLNWSDIRIAPFNEMPDISPGYERRETFAGYRPTDHPRVEAIPFSSIERTLLESGNFKVVNIADSGTE